LEDGEEIIVEVEVDAEVTGFTLTNLQLDAAATEAPLNSQVQVPAKLHSRDPLSGMFHLVARWSRVAEGARPALSLADIKRFMS
jgi:hypothetical protein